MATNFHLAPPAKDVDGFHATPIDIQRITAHLTFDGATSTGSGDATLEFTTGPEDGFPIVDLRQTITGLWLDSNPLLLTQAAQHDFAGGAGAELRIVESSLLAGTAHTLRVTYSLGAPQASGAGSYQPNFAWDFGPRLRFNFGFTDLGPGRYLEAWVPANLIFDQFALVLDLELVNTAVAHSTITNGNVTVIAVNHWTVTFPAHITAFSPLLEIRATDTLASQSDTVALPAPNPVVTIEAWKLASSVVNLTTQISNLKTFLTDNANQIGPYLHGNRFVAFFIQGGMEYDGGTTTSTGALRHETHHSWWGRGVKPASQNDAWWDEAWTQYVTGGGTPLAFNFADPPVVLHSQNPWVRETAGASYTDDFRFFQGVASLLGEPALKSSMASLFQAHGLELITTLDLESHLLCASGNEELVDDFHRWIYGFGDTAAAADLWVRDDPGHSGAEAWEGRFWDSPDLWIRNHDDGGMAHQNPVAGSDNWFYARVRNQGSVSARHFMMTFTMKQFAGTQFVYAADFLPCMAATGGFELGPTETRVVKAKWPASLVPSAGTHGCLLASVHARGNHPVGGRYVWEENALAQKNLTIVALAHGRWAIVPLVIGHWRFPRRVLRLELRRPRGLADLVVSVLYPLATSQRPRPDKTRLDCAGSAASQTSGLDAFENAREQVIPRKRVAKWNVDLRSGLPLLIGLRLKLPERLASNRPILLDVVQLDAKERPVGGVAIRIEETK